MICQFFFLNSSLRARDLKWDNVHLQPSVTGHVSQVIWQVSCVMCQVSGVMSFVLSYFVLFLFQTDGLSCMRVCYQQRLPCPVKCIHIKGSHIFKKNGLNRGIARKGKGGFNPCPNVLEHFLWTFIFWQNAKGGGVKAMTKDFEHFKKFYIAEFH